jgi:hypothetical protein
MISKAAFTVWCCLFPLVSLHAQYWEDMEFGPSGQINNLSSNGSQMLVTGQAGGGGPILNESFVWDGIIVNQLPMDTFIYQVTRAALFQGITHVVHGAGQTVGLHRYVNNQWQQVAIGEIAGLRARDSLLFVLFFSPTVINGQEFNRIAAYDGENFHVVDNGLTDESVGFADLWDALWYKDEFYVAGNIYLPGLWDIARWNPVSGLWADADGGFPGDWSVVGMLEHNELLIIYGEFEESTGCPGNNIVAWDGERYWRLGEGTNGVISDAVVFNNELYVTGGFDNVNGIPAQGFAKWDGNNWCALPAGTAASKLTVFQDNIYGIQVKNTEFSSADPILRLGKWVYEGEPLGCAETEPIGITEKPSHQESIVVFPNPATSTITISAKLGGINAITLFDIAGREVKSIEEVPKANTTTIDVSGLPTGIYFGRAHIGESTRSFKWVKQ